MPDNKHIFGAHVIRPDETTKELMQGFGFYIKELMFVKIFFRKYGNVKELTALNKMTSINEKCTSQGKNEQHFLKIIQKKTKLNKQKQYRKKIKRLTFK